MKKLHVLIYFTHNLAQFEHLFLNLKNVMIRMLFKCYKNALEHSSSAKDIVTLILISGRFLSMLKNVFLKH